MKFQSACVKEIKRVAVGCCVCLVAMLAAFILLSSLGFASIRLSVVVGGLAGTAVAILNFAGLCLTVQNAACVKDVNKRKARIQTSYYIRLICQAAWVVAAFRIPRIHTIAAAVPLLFPNAVIFFLQVWDGVRQRKSVGRETDGNIH